MLNALSRSHPVLADDLTFADDEQSVGGKIDLRAVLPGVGELVQSPVVAAIFFFNSASGSPFSGTATPAAMSSGGGSSRSASTRSAADTRRQHQHSPPTRTIVCGIDLLSG
jgi:hypothetical protein